MAKSCTSNLFKKKEETIIFGVCIRCSAVVKRRLIFDVQVYRQHAPYIPVRQCDLGHGRSINDSSLKVFFLFRILFMPPPLWMEGIFYEASDVRG